MPIRVALLDLPEMLSDIVRDAFSAEVGFIVEVLPDGTGPPGILEADPDVVMVGLTEPRHYGPAGDLLRIRPELGLFGISPDARQAWIHELTPTSRPLGEVSAASLRDAVAHSVERHDR